MNLWKNICRLWLRKGHEVTVRDAIEELIEENDEAVNDTSAGSEMEMLGNVLDLRNTQVQDIMIPRIEIRAVPVTAGVNELIHEFTAYQISSVLVYKGGVDNIFGVVYLKDVVNYLKMHRKFDLNVFVKDVLFVPPTMRTLDLLLQMKATGIKVAVVVDEYGGVDGFCAFADLIEEIIGDIQDADERKQIKQRVIKNQDGSFTVDARITLVELNKILGINISTNDNTVDTIGGYVSMVAGKVPVRGELVNDSKFDFEILDSDPRHVKSVKIREVV